MPTTSVSIAIAAHPTLRAATFTTEFPASLGDLPSPAWLVELLQPNADTPLRRSEELRTAIRDMLRHGGYKPTGRGKPASEYLVRAADDGGLRSINAAVDVCNVVSLHSGIPISLIDTDRATPPFHIAIAEGGASYIFNASGQEIDIGGLVCLFDANGPCANAVKDAQRSKTTDTTRRTLSVLWGCAGFESALTQADSYYRELLDRLGDNPTAS